MGFVPSSVASQPKGWADLGVDHRESKRGRLASHRRPRTVAHILGDSGSMKVELRMLGLCSGARGSKVVEGQPG